MVKQSKGSELPTAGTGSLRSLHHRTTSVPTTLLSAANNTSSGSTVAMDPRKGHGRVKSISHATSEPITSGPVIRGKDWESLHWERPGPVQSDPSLFKPLKKTSFFGSESQQKSSQGTSFQRSQLASPLPISLDILAPKSAPPLATSVVRTYLHHSPASPMHGINALSQVSAGDQSAGTPPPRKIGPTRTPSLEDGPIPKHVSAFEYAMRPFLDTLVDDSHEQLLQLPPPTHRVDSSPRRLLLPDAAETVYDSDKEGFLKDRDITEFDTPSHLWENDVFTNSMQQTQISVYLMHCITLQGIVDQIQREPWKSSQNQSAALYYGKMVELTYKARPLAEALKSDELQARCEYWAGRGCGGLRDYGAAERHFHQAMLLDVPNDKCKNGKTRMRGLLPKEKADVRFLLDSCHKRAKTHQSWEKRIMKDIESVRSMANKDGLPLDAYADQIQQAMPSSPPWLPDRDHLVALARAEFEKASQDGGGNSLQALGEEAQVDPQTEDEYMQAENRRRLTAKEWAYIKYGDVQEAERRERQKSAEGAFTPLPKHSTASTLSTSTTSNIASLASLRDLANELAGSGYDGSTPEASPTSEYSPSSQDTPVGASEQKSSVTSPDLPHETENLQWEHPSPSLKSTPARSLGSAQALTPNALELHLLSTSQTLPHEPTDADWQRSSRSRTPSLEQNPSLSTDSSIFTDHGSEAPFLIDFLLDKEDYDYRLQASSPPQLNLQQRRRGSYLDPISTIPIPPRSNRRPVVTQAENQSPRTPLSL